MKKECGGSTPLFSGQPRLPELCEPRLAGESGAEAPHSTRLAGESGAEAPQSTSLRTNGSIWHHAPVHLLLERGIYMVTAGTYGKALFFNTPERRDLLLARLLACTEEYGWDIQVWAVMANHYHFVACSPADPASLRRVLNKLHMTTAKAVNELDGTPGRKVWFEYWDTRLTYERSYLARVRYVNENPVHHKLVAMAAEYRWCSAAHFEKVAPASFRRTVAAMPIDTVEVHDEY